jgi:hypothetical protein
VRRIDQMSDTPKTPDFYREAHNACNRMVRNDMLDDPRMTFAAVRVGNYLLKKFMLSNKGYAWPAIRTIASDLNLAKQTVVTAVELLENLEYFTVRRSDRPGRGVANEYIPHLPVKSGGGGKGKGSNSAVEKGSNSAVEKGSSTVVHIRDSKEKEKTNVFSLSSESKKPAKQSPRWSAGRALSAFEKVAEKLQKDLEPRDIWNWSTFWDEIMSVGGYSLRRLFLPEDMSISAFEYSMDRFRKLVVVKAQWKDSIEASQKLIDWLSKEKLRGEGWGEEYYG